MGTIIDGKLESRDYVVHIFSGILFNVFLFLALRPTLLPYIHMSEVIHNEIIISIIAIPILFLEGHFLLAIDRLLFIEIPSWIFGAKCDKSSSMADKSNKAPFRTARENLYDEHRMFFIILFGKRITGQKTIRKAKHPDYVKTTIPEILSPFNRYSILSDFFKGVGCAAWIAFIVACMQQNWTIVGLMSIVIILAWFRARFYSSRYAKQYYVKNTNVINQPT